MYFGTLAGGLGSFPFDCPTYLVQSDSRITRPRHSEFDKLRFEENQLSPGSIGISPLSTPHPHPFQRMWVRSSTAFYGNFNLDMDRSPGFGSALSDSLALLRLGFPSAPHLQCLTLPDRTTRRTVLQKVRGRAFPHSHSL